MSRVRSRVERITALGAAVADRWRTALDAARASDGGTGPGLASLSIGVLSLLVVAVTALGRFGDTMTRHAPPPVRATHLEAVAASAETRPPLVTMSAALRDPTLAEERALDILDEVAADPRDSATDVLLAATESPSLVVSMASMRALRGRPCGRVAPLLAGYLEHGDWQRRAWAAKILGENGCSSAAPLLRSRLARESDARVWRQLGEALAALDTRGIG